MPGRVGGFPKNNATRIIRYMDGSIPPSTLLLLETGVPLLLRPIALLGSDGLTECRCGWMGWTDASSCWSSCMDGTGLIVTPGGREVQPPAGLTTSDQGVPAIVTGGAIREGNG